MQHKENEEANELQHFQPQQLLGVRNAVTLYTCVFSPQN
jgi:hypothetical protein